MDLQVVAWEEEHGLDSSGLEGGQVAVCCAHGNGYKVS
jgi:hypothetical protein